MTTMNYDVFDAFKAAGVPEEKARKAAEALAEDHSITKGDIQEIRVDLAVLKWMAGVNLVVGLGIMVRLLFW